MSHRGIAGPVAVLGAGAWGTAMAIHAAASAVPGGVRLWARDATQVAELTATRLNARYLPGFVLPDGVEPVANFDAAIDEAALVIVATSVSGLRETLQQLATRSNGGCPKVGVVWLCKGFDAVSGALAHEVAEPLMAGMPCGVLSGPSFAQEVAAGLPVALTAASASEALVRQMTTRLHHGAMRIYGSSDVVGVEVAGALKNVMAIATGMCDGLGLGANARAALLTRGLAEMTRLGVALGADRATFAGLAGIGDLVLTCTGDLSRNRRVGLRLAAGDSLQAIVAGLGHVAEGAVGCRAAVERARLANVEMPVSEAVLEVLERRLSPGAAVERLLSREPRVAEAEAP